MSTLLFAFVLFSLQKLSRQVRLFIGSEGGPPAFTPFGQKTKDKKPPAIKKGEYFNSLYKWENL